jgi:hypothetical protein
MEETLRIQAEDPHCLSEALNGSKRDHIGEGRAIFWHFLLLRSRHFNGFWRFAPLTVAAIDCGDATIHHNVNPTCWDMGCLAIRQKMTEKRRFCAPFQGYIGEHSAYHHGEASLHGTIIGMAQTFCGSNNLNLLTPSGQFGTRRMGGKDAASPRYIFTKIEKITRAIFHPDDDELLTYLNDDGLSIEPEHFMPVIPLVLVNGSDEIGTVKSRTLAVRYKSQSRATSHPEVTRSTIRRRRRIGERASL